MFYRDVPLFEGVLNMATNSEPIQVSSLPLPPMHYINQYTDEMIRRGRAPRPPPPIRDQYQMFGNTFNTEESIIRPLESQVRIYEKLSKSAICHFKNCLTLIMCFNVFRVSNDYIPFTLIDVGN